jgi:hypothetical protein
VSKYALSAHADANELARLIDVLNPREIVLVHGDSDARLALADLLYRTSAQHRPIHLPKTGDTIRVGSMRKATPTAARAFAPGIGGDTPLTVETLPQLADHVRGLQRKQPYSVAELLDLWYGVRAWDDTHYAALVRLLDTPGLDFRRLPSRPHLYQVAPAADQLQPSRAAQPGFAEPNALLARVDSLLGPHTGLYKRGYHLLTHELRLFFDFPQIARVRYQDLIDQVVAGTGWSVVVNEMPQQERLFAVALACLPAGATVTKAPALHLDRHEVILTLAAELPEPACRDAMAKFLEQTGFSLTLTWPGTAAPSPSPPQLSTAAPTTPRLEINAAYQAIEEAFAGRPDTERPYRKSLKTGHDGAYIELAFLTPEAGAHHHELLQHLSTSIGYELRIKPEPNQIALIALVRQLIPPAWQIAKPPGVFKADRTVRVKCLTPPATDAPEWHAVHSRFAAATGYTLLIESGAKGSGHKGPR